MSPLLDALAALWADESGEDAAEYVLLIVLIALVVITGMQLLTGEMLVAFPGDGIGSP